MSKCSQGSVLICVHSTQYVKVSLVWIPSHCDIVYNDLADSSAKAAIKDADDITTIAALTTNACKNMINKQCHISWQHSWNISNTGRATYEYDPRVGQKPFLPKDRHTAVNYLRLLLHDSVFDRHSYKTGANTTKACACGNTINDVHHFLLECPTHSLARQDLITSVTDIWNNSDETGKIVISVPLLLAPTAHSRLTAAECYDILLATFHFIRLSGLNL